MTAVELREFKTEVRAGGIPGVGLPKGGQAGQTVVKVSDADFDTQWTDIATQLELDTVVGNLGAEVARATQSEADLLALINGNSNTIVAETNRATAAENANTALINALDAAIDQANIAYVNVANVFTQNQSISAPAGGSALTINANSAPWALTLHRTDQPTLDVNVWNNAGKFEVRGGMRVLPRLASDIASVVQAQASQSADLQQWQDSTGAALALVNSTGTFRGSALASVTPGKAVYITNYDTGSVGIATGGDTNKGLVIRRNSGSQSANLQEWQSESGGALARMSPAGLLTVNILNAINGVSAAAIPVKVQGVAGQTGDLTQWQDSTGAVMVKVAPSGYISQASDTGSTPTLLLQNTSAIDGRTVISFTNNRTTSQNYLLGIDPDGGVGKRFVLRNITAGTYPFVVNADGRVGIGPGVTTPSAMLAVYNTAGTAVPTVHVRPIAAQTASLQEWQDSAGGLLTRINAGGAIANFGAVGSLSIGPNSTSLSNYQADIISGSASAVGLIVRGAASQSADLQQWQDSTGAVKASVGAAGDVYTVGGVRADSGFNSGTSALSLVRNAFFTSGANVVGLAIRGAASQSADLQQWQDSTGAVLAKITSAGNASVNRLIANSTIAAQAANAASWQVTVGAAGPAAAPPATPTKYLKVLDDTGTTLVIPAYAAA